MKGSKPRTSSKEGANSEEGAACELWVVCGVGGIREFDCVDPEGCMQFEKAQRRPNIIHCLIVLGYKLRL